MSDGSVIIDTKLNNDGVDKGVNKLKGSFSKLGSIAGSALKGVAVATGIATTAVAGLVTASINAYAEYEQLVGGVDTLFKNSSEKIQMYANDAYKTAGLSANEYMSTVTSFSASLLQSLGGDTEKSADYANQAIIDMSDNANKMGTSMDMIQNAYQGFAKQNYTMLDNLKLGYGGTKTEMERLLADAQKISGIKYDISSFSDITQAIHVIQTEMGITGTTAKEASTTIQGSINSMKASWNNLLVGLSDKDADLSKLIGNLVDSASTVGKNLLPVIEQALLGVGTLIEELLPVIVERIPIIFNEILPQLLQSGINIINTLIQGIAENIPTIMQSAIQIINLLLVTWFEMLPQLYQMGITILVELIKGIGQSLPTLIPIIINSLLLIVETVIDNIDLIIDAGIQLILGLAEGLIEALPRLIEKIPVIIEKLLIAITDNLPKILEMGITLIIKLVEGLIKAIPSLIKAIPQIIMALINGFKNYMTNMQDLGKNIVEGLWNGIKNAGSWLANKVKSFASGILDGMKNALGIHSPSRLFRDEVGKFIALGVGEGFTDNIDSVYKQMKSTVDFETQKLSANLSTTASFNKIFTANINLNGDTYLDNEKVGRMVAPVVSRTFGVGGAY